MPDLRGIDGLSGAYSPVPPRPVKDFTETQAAPNAPLIDPGQLEMRVMPYDGYERPGTIIVNFEGFKLYHIRYDGMATEYPIALGAPRH